MDRFFFSSRRRHTRCSRDWSSDVCSSDLASAAIANLFRAGEIEMVAQSIEQSDAWLNGQLFLLAVDAQGHGHRAGANYFAGAQNRIGHGCCGGSQLVTSENLRRGGDAGSVFPFDEFTS